MSKSYADISLSPALAQFQHRRQSPSAAAPPPGSGSYTSPYYSLAALRNLPRRSLIRIAVLLALGIPLALLLAGSSPFAFPNASSSAGVGSGTGAGAGAYGQKRSDTGLAWNRPPGGGEGRGIGGFWGFGSGSRSGVDDDGGRGQGAGGREAVLDLVESMPLTSFDGGLAGYTVFSNLYLSSGAFLHVSEPPSTLEEGVPPRPLDVQNSDAPTAADAMDRWAKKGSKSTGKSSSVQVDTQRPPLPHARQIMSGPRTPEGRYEAAGEERWRVVDQTVAQGELGERAVYLSGVTYIFNDEAGDTGYLVYFKHFVLEAFLGATRSLAHVLRHTGQLAGVNGAEKAIPLPERIWFPRCGARPSWRDGKGENVWFLHHALPGVQIEDASGFADRAAAGLPVIFERAVIIDRWSAHSVGGESAAWGKMNADVASLSAPAHFWDGIKGNFMRSLGVDGPSRIGTGRRGLPVVVYIDGQTGSSQLSAESHAALVQALKGLTGIAEVHVTKLGAMKRPQQLDLMGRTDIVIAAHTDDLFNALWMPASDKSAVIELFEEGGFDRSFELLATALNHRYFAVQKDKVLSEAEWRAVGSHRGETATSGFEIDGALVAKTIETILRGPVEGSSVEDR